MRLTLALALLLAACGVATAPKVPPELRACPGAAEAPPRLPAIRTPEALLSRYYAERAARLEDEASLAACAGRLARVLGLLER